MDLDPEDFTPNSGADLQEEPYTSEIVLTDGGVYDNHGLEALHNFNTGWRKGVDFLVVSDAAVIKGDFERYHLATIRLVAGIHRANAVRWLRETVAEGLATGKRLLPQ